MARPADLLSVEDARSRILARFHRLDAERVPLSQSLGRILAESLDSPILLPPFANSSMDGFALSSVATAGASSQRPASLPVTQYIPAGGVSPERLGAGECARIMTGAPIPSGADAVIPFEEVQDHGDTIDVPREVTSGSCVRPAGQDVRPGTPLLPAGETLGPAQIGLLAATGYAELPVVHRPVVSVLATGDELVSPGTALAPGQIYNSNTPMLVAALVEAGADPRPLPTVPDTREALEAALRSAEGSNLLITSGGASVGDFDYVKDVVGATGDLTFWRVRMRPGKPLLFGRVGSVPVIGLPGNPTSAMATFEQFVRPAIRTMLGAPPLRPEVEVIVDERIDNRGGRRTYARARLSLRDGRIHARLAGPQDSAMLLPLARADGLVVIPEDRGELSPGDTAVAQVWRVPRGEAADG